MGVTKRVKVVLGDPKHPDKLFVAHIQARCGKFHHQSSWFAYILVPPFTMQCLLYHHLGSVDMCLTLS